MPAQREVGMRWERREWTAAHELAATSIADAALAMLTLDAVPSRGGHLRSVVSKGSGTLWRSAWRRFRVRGWATFLGPSVPAVDLGAYATASRPDAVALSCSLPILLPGAHRCIRACRAGGLPVLVAGAGFPPDGRHAVALGAGAWAQDPVAGVGHLECWLDASPPIGNSGPEPEEEDLLLEISHAELVAEALHRLVSQAPTGLRAWSTFRRLPSASTWRWPQGRAPPSSRVRAAVGVDSHHRARQHIVGGAGLGVRLRLWTTRAWCPRCGSARPVPPQLSSGPFPSSAGRFDQRLT